MEKKNTIMLVVIGLVTLLVAVVGATFAYWSTNTAGATGKAVVTATTGKADASFTCAGTAISLSVSAENMQQAKSASNNFLAASATGTLTANYTAPTGSSSSCKYDIVASWGNTSYKPSVANTTSVKEFTIQITNPTGVTPTSNSVSSETQIMQGTDGTNYSLPNSGTLVSGISISGSNAATITQNWPISVKFYNLKGQNQTAVADKTYVLNISCANVVC